MWMCFAGAYLFRKVSSVVVSLKTIDKRSLVCGGDALLTALVHLAMYNYYKEAYK